VAALVLAAGVPLTATAVCPPGGHSKEGGQAATLVRQLGDPSFAVRERAGKELVRMGRAAEAALRAGLTDPDPEVRRRCAWLLPLALRPKPRLTLPSPHALSLIAFTPDSRSLLTARKRVIPGGLGLSLGRAWDAIELSGPIEIWDTTSGQKRAAFLQDAGSGVNYNTEMLDLAVSPDGKLLAVQCAGRVLKVVDLPSGRLRAAFDVPHGARSTSARRRFSLDGSLLAFTRPGEDSGSVVIWDVRARRMRATCAGQDWPLAFSADGRMLAACAYRRDEVGWVGSASPIQIWDTATGRVLRTLEGSRGMMCEVQFAPDGRSLGSVAYDSTRSFLGVSEARVWNVMTGRLRATLPGAWGELEFVCDGRKMFAEYGHPQEKEHGARWWDAATGKVVRTLRLGPDTQCRLAPGGRLLAVLDWHERRASTSPDDDLEFDVLELLDCASGKRIARYEGCCGARVARDGRALATEDAAGAIRLWDIPRVPPTAPPAK
jgi:hypothetical protein